MERAKRANINQKREFTPPIFGGVNTMHVRHSCLSYRLGMNDTGAILAAPTTKTAAHKILLAIGILIKFTFRNWFIMQIMAIL